jgi:transcriptional regulator with PAS, ATPase and Fis domain
VPAAGAERSPRAEAAPRSYRYSYDGLIGESAAMASVFELLERVIETDYPVIIQGESGTGKELIARAIHFNGRRRDKPLIAENCAALNENLLEAELFGYEKGSFTDARESKVGLIEAAEDGTAFLDEVGDLELALQGKLLRAIEEHTVRRVGSVRDRKVDVWIVAATNKDLAAMMASGTFRKDLYYRLAVVTLKLPPLRERQEDIAILAEFFLGRFSAKYGRQLKRLSARALARLAEYGWPGNVRELRHVLERAVLATPPAAAELDEAALASLPQDAALPSEPVAPAGLPASGASLAEWERAMILKALTEARGNQTKAARILGVSRDTLRYRLAKFKINDKAIG